MIIVGSNSMIGSRFLELSQHTNLVQLNFPELDLIKNNSEEIFDKLSTFKNDVLVLFSAFTDVDGAEAQRGDKAGTCWQLNVEGTKKIVGVCQRLNLKIVYLSTDFVFDGIYGPYSEEDTVTRAENDVSWYAWTKLIGEEVVKNLGNNFLIARTSYPYRANFSGKVDFVRNIVQRLKENSLYPMFDDQFLTPTFIDNFVKALFILIRENQTGIWHLVDNTTLSAYEAACETAKVFGFDIAKIEKASLAEFQKNNPQTAIRPAKGGLKNDKLRKFLHEFGQDMQGFEEALLQMKKQISSDMV